MNKAFEMILERLEEERELSYADFSRYVEEVSPYLDDEYDDFFHKGLERASRLVKEVAEEYNNGWIACSERLPEVIEQDMQDLYPHVLVYAEEEDEWNIYVGIYGMYKPKEWVDAHNPTKIIENAIAWQPLPEPFKECD